MSLRETSSHRCFGELMDGLCIRCMKAERDRYREALAEIRSVYRVQATTGDPVDVRDRMARTARRALEGK